MVPGGRWAAAAMLLSPCCAAQTLVPNAAPGPSPTLGAVVTPVAGPGLGAFSAPSQSLSLPAMAVSPLPSVSAPSLAAPGRAAAVSALAVPPPAPLPAASLAAPARAAAAPVVARAEAPTLPAAAVPQRLAGLKPWIAAPAPAAESSPMAVLEAAGTSAEAFARSGSLESFAESSRMWDGSARGGADDPFSLAAALVSGKASPDFVKAVREHVARSFPSEVLLLLRSAGYRVEVSAHVRQNREDLDPGKDSVSGYHAHGPKENVIIIGETVRDSPAGEWEKGRNWENAVNHEFGLAISRVLGDAEAARVEAADPKLASWYRSRGISESPEFREAWRRDYDAMPPELKQEKDPDGESNSFFWFLQPDKNGWFQEARGRTFAEGLDILLRGPGSAYNYDDFTFHFPRTLAAIRSELEARLGWRIPEPAPAPQPHGAWERADASVQELAGLLVSGAARPDFVANVRAHVARTFTPELLRDLLRGGYRIAADEYVRQGRPGLHEDNDLRGGFHTYGTKGNLIVVARTLRLRGTDRWVESLYWENAINHEIGHALAYLHGEAEARRVAASDARQARWYRKKGLSESPAFREAWRRDYEAMPEGMKKEWTEDELENRFYYFVHPDAGGWFQRARQETLAEAFDVLLRGPRSAVNYSDFTRYFPNVLKELRREMGSRYPGLF